VAHATTAPNRGSQIYEGKAKRVYETDDPTYVIFEYKDDATAFNGVKHDVFAGKGGLNNALSSTLFAYLSSVGVENHFVRTLSEREQLCRRVEIIPLEVVVRNRAAGSMAKRLGIDEGSALRATVVELCYKRDDLGDPLVGVDHAVAIGAATYAEIGWMERTARTVNTVLGRRFRTIGIELVDFKLEFGRVPSENGRLVLADEISPDTCRLWDTRSQERFDKDRFRRDLAPLLDGYREVLARLEASRGAVER
jgi:phosphoribosylaminoimidazole-succinocarboxamide synthase